MTGSITDFTTGSIRKALIRFSIPFFLTSLIQTLYNIADIMIVGHFCNSAGIAGTSIGGSVTNTVAYTIIGLCNGGSIMTAQYVGRKDEKAVTETIGTTFSLMLLLSIISTAVSLILSGQILSALNTPPEAFVQTRTYFTVCMSGSVFVFGYNSIASILRGLGDSKTPLYFGLSSCILNITLDIIFVALLGLGVAGAAAATVIAQASSMIGCIIYLKKTGFIFDFKIHSFKLDAKKALTILKLGLPGAVQNMIVSGGFLMLSSITNSLGVYAASGVAVASKITNLGGMPTGAIGMSVSAMVAQNVGAKNYDRASEVTNTGMLISFSIAIVTFAIVQLMPMPLLRLLVQDGQVLEKGLEYLRIASIDFFTAALVFPLNGLCNGSGHTLFTMIPSTVSSVVARVPVAILCVKVFGMGLSGVALSIPTGTLSAIIICYLYYHSGRWHRRVI